MNNCINILSDKVRKKEAFIAVLAKYEPVNCGNVHVTKEKEKNSPTQRLYITKLEKNTLSKLQNKAVPIDERISIQKTTSRKELMNETLITTPRKGEKLLLKNSTYKDILKKDENPKKEAFYYNETNFPNYDVKITKVRQQILKNVKVSSTKHLPVKILYQRSLRCVKIRKLI